MSVKSLSKSTVAQGLITRSKIWDQVANPNFIANFLVIAGGGGGSDGQVNQYDGGGGNAEGYRVSTGGTGYRGAAAESPLSLTLGTDYTVTVGAGGSNKTAGSNSVFSSITSNGSPAGTPYTGGGNGTGGVRSGMTGGAGTANNITGSNVTRAGGGGGGNVSPGSGQAGGGNGSSNGPGGNATANTGSGGGGGRSTSGNQPGGNGGSGLVVLQYPSTLTITIGSGLTSSTATVGVNKVTTFTAGTGIVSFT